MNINAVDTILSEADILAIKTKITDTRKLMPFLINLSAKERQAGFKMSNKRYNFVSEVITVCEIEPTVVPVWVNPAELKRDYELTNELFGIENLLESLLSDVRDTRMRLGIEALKSATDVYGLVQKSKNRIPGAESFYDTLRASYPGRGKNKKKE